MLVLSRKEMQSIVISGGITVTVVTIRGDKVKLAFEAPPDVTIMREEILSTPPATDGAESEPQETGTDPGSGRGRVQ